jgi:hypothetical protein
MQHNLCNQPRYRPDKVIYVNWGGKEKWNRECIGKLKQKRNHVHSYIEPRIAFLIAMELMEGQRPCTVHNRLRFSWIRDGFMFRSPTKSSRERSSETRVVEANVRRRKMNPGDADGKKKDRKCIHSDTGSRTPDCLFEPPKTVYGWRPCSVHHV